MLARTWPTVMEKSAGKGSTESGTCIEQFQGVDHRVHASLNRLRMKEISPQVLALIYAAFALPFVLLLAMLVPPLQAPDEVAHFGRADQISHGEFFAYRIAPGASGGRIDLGLVEALQRFAPIALHAETKVSRDLYAPIGWGAVEARSFPNTALYPPMFYAPSVVAIWCGKALGFDVLHTATLARLFTGVVSVGISAMAIAFADVAGIWLFALLLLPSSALLMGAISQDGPMLACAALAVSLMTSLQREASIAWRGRLLLLCAIIASMGMARPPYSALAILPLALTRLRVSVRWSATLATFAAAATWSICCAIWTLVSVDPFHKADAVRQLHYIEAHSGLLPALVADTLSRYFATEYAGYFVAPLLLPGLYFQIAWIVLAVALVASFLAGARPMAWTILTVGAAVFAAVFGIFAIQYLTWTAVGGSTIDGVLGRYFLPLAVLLGCCLVRRSQLPGNFWLYPVVAGFPVIGSVISIHAILLRFYF